MKSAPPPPYIFNPIPFRFLLPAHLLPIPNLPSSLSSLSPLTASSFYSCLLFPSLVCTLSGGSVSNGISSADHPEAGSQAKCSEAAAARCKCMYLCVCVCSHARNPTNRHKHANNETETQGGGETCTHTMKKKKD